FESERLGAQAALGGGGRYDGLVEELGGPPTPGVGFAAGIERMLLAAGDEPLERPSTVFIAYPADRAREAFALARSLRGHYRVEMEQAGRSLKGQLKQADRIGAFATVLLGEGMEVKNMETGTQEAAGDVDDVHRIVKEVAQA